MKKTNSPAVVNASADRFLKKLALILAFLPPLIDTLIFFPLQQITLANLGAGVLYQILSVASQLLNLSSFFAIVALAVYCVYADDLSALGRVFALQGISYLSAVVLLRTFVYWALAVLDDTFILGSFSFCNLTLQKLTDSGGMMLIWSAISLFINVIMLILLLLIVTAIALLLYRRGLKKSIDFSLKALTVENNAAQQALTCCFRLATLIYLIQALINEIYDTVQSLGASNTSIEFAELAPMIAPYFLLAIYACVGYWIMQLAARAIARKAFTLSASAN